MAHLKCESSISVPVDRQRWPRQRTSYSDELCSAESAIGTIHRALVAL